jgi:hypothetical protein
MSKLRWIAVSNTRQNELEKQMSGARWRVVSREQPVTRGELRRIVRETLEELPPERRARLAARRVSKGSPSGGTPAGRLEGLLAREHEVDRAPIEWDFGDGRSRRASSRGTLAKSGKRASFRDALAEQPAKHQDGRVTLADGTIVAPDGRVYR